MLFAYKAFQYAGASAARKVVDAFNSGVKLKLVLSAVLFALCFKFIENLQLPAFFITYFLPFNSELCSFAVADVNPINILAITKVIFFIVKSLLVFMFSYVDI